MRFLDLELNLKFLLKILTILFNVNLFLRIKETKKWEKESKRSEVQWLRLLKCDGKRENMEIPSNARKPQKEKKEWKKWKKGLKERESELKWKTRERI